MKAVMPQNKNVKSVEKNLRIKVLITVANIVHLWIKFEIKQNFENVTNCESVKA